MDKLNSQEIAYVVDTNVWYRHIEELKLLSESKKIVVTGAVLRELDKHKSSSDKELAFKSRTATRFIKENKNKFIIDLKDYNAEEILGEEYSNLYMDNLIVACAKVYGGLISGDLNVQFKGIGLGLDVIDLSDITNLDDHTGYTGIRELFISDKEEDDELLARIYTEKNPLDMVLNEYLVIWDKDKTTIDSLGKTQYDLVDTLRFDGERLVKLKFKQTEDRFMGRTKPINVKQRLAFDLMQNKDIVGAMILGGAGSGKDHIIASHMMQKLQNGEIDKIVFVRNIQPLKDSGQVGFLPGDLNEKMLSWSMPLCDQIGGIEALQMLIDQGKIEIQHFESIRGRSFKNCGVWVTEMQSMSSYHAKVLISRIGEGTFLYMNGDINQTDEDARKIDSAINTIKKLKGNKMFGVVTLDKTERSDFSALAELL